MALLCNETNFLCHQQCDLLGHVLPFPQHFFSTIGMFVPCASITVSMDINDGVDFDVHASYSVVSNLPVIFFHFWNFLSSFII